MYQYLLHIYNVYNLVRNYSRPRRDKNYKYIFIYNSKLCVCVCVILNISAGSLLLYIRIYSFHMRQSIYIQTICRQYQKVHHIYKTVHISNISYIYHYTHTHTHTHAFSTHARYVGTFLYTNLLLIYSNRQAINSYQKIRAQTLATISFLIIFFRLPATATAPKIPSRI